MFIYVACATGFNDYLPMFLQVITRSYYSFRLLHRLTQKRLTCANLSFKI